MSNLGSIDSQFLNYAFTVKEIDADASHIEYVIKKKKIIFLS